MVCDKTAQIHRYLDGELSSAQQEAVEAHVRECAECDRMLTDLRRLSQLISAAPLAEMPAENVARLQEGWQSARERGVRRIAGWLTAAAATILIGVVLTRPAQQPDADTRPAVWETIAVMPPDEVHEETSPDLLAMAQWMADDLSSNETR